MSLVPLHRPALEPVAPRLLDPPAPPPARRAGADPAVREYVPGLALRGISGHLARSTTGTTAWYAIAARPWSMRADGEREALMNDLGLALAQLPGRWLHWRVTWRPFPAAEWARRHDDWARPLPDAPGGTAWDAHVLGEQRRALAAPKAVKEVYLGVEVRHGRSRLGALGDALAGRVAGWAGRTVDRWVDAELAALDADVRELDSILASSALGGRPVSAAEMLHLLYRSCALGLPAETVMPAAPHGDWEREDLAAVDGLARWTADPYAPAVTVNGVAARQQVTRHVVIASVGRMGDIDVPGEDLPWMTVTDDLPVPVEWSARMRVLPREQATRSLRQVADRVDAQRRHYETDHGREAPAELVRRLDLAAQVRDELESDRSPLAGRCEGWWRIAIPGRTEREALELFDDIRGRYHPKIAIERSEAQYRLAREFVPGEPLATTAFRRRMSLRHVATAVPQVTDMIGDGHGPLLFTSRTSGRPIAWDPWHDIDTRQMSGLTPVVGGPGSGKTFLIGALAAQVVRSRGAFVTLLDPSGSLTRLAELPELRGYARSITLLDAPPGTLNPFALVSDPARHDYGPAGDAAWRRDVELAAAQRASLVVGVLAQLLPAAVRRGGGVRHLLLQAVERVGHDGDHDLGEVVAALAHAGADGERLATALAPVLSPTGPARLLLGRPEAGSWSAGSDRLLVVSTRGIVAPREGVDPADLSLDEQLALPLLHLAAWLAYRRVHELPRSVPKLVGLDELRRLSSTPTGRTLVAQLVRDSRKHRARVLVAGRLASDVLDPGPDGGPGGGLTGLCHDVFVGRTTDRAAQADALRLLRLPPGHEDRLAEPGAHLGADAPREFVWRSGPHCEQVRVDVSGPHLAGLRAALDTNVARDRR